MCSYIFCLTFRLIFFQTLLDHQWDRIGTGPERKPPAGWSVFGQTWSHDELAVVRGELPLGIRPWHDVDIVSVYSSFASMFIRVLITPWRNTCRFWFLATLEVCIGSWPASICSLGTFLCLTRSDERSHLGTGMPSLHVCAICYPLSSIRCTFTGTDNRVTRLTKRRMGRSGCYSCQPTGCPNRNWGMTISSCYSIPIGFEMNQC